MALISRMMMTYGRHNQVPTGQTLISGDKQKLSPHFDELKSLLLKIALMVLLPTLALRKYQAMFSDVKHIFPTG